VFFFPWNFLIRPVFHFFFHFFLFAFLLVFNNEHFVSLDIPESVPILLSDECLCLSDPQFQFLKQTS
jgi:hypothetical protein